MRQLLGKTSRISTCWSPVKGNAGYDNQEASGEGDNGFSALSEHVAASQIHSLRTSLAPIGTQMEGYANTIVLLDNTAVPINYDMIETPSLV